MLADAQRIDLDPSFQRRHRWGLGAKSRLIESFILNLPVPQVYLAADDAVYKVIDGKQRLTAIVEFLNNDFRLSGLEYVKQFEGHYFAELPQNQQVDLQIRSLRVISLQRGQNEELIRTVFRRLNTGGIELNRQEIRNVLYDNKLHKKIQEVSKNKLLQQSLKIKNKRSPAYSKMADIELVLRFVTLASKWKSFSGSLADAMDNTLASWGESLSEDRRLFNLADNFPKYIERAEGIWGNHRFQRWDPEKEVWRDRAIMGLFDAQMIAMAGLSDRQYEVLYGRRDEFLYLFKQAFEDSDFVDSVTVSTNTTAFVRLRINTLQNLVSQITGI